jgi:hypothetical protein
VTEEADELWVTPPVGYWLRDGRLVSSRYTDGERVKPYHGSKSEISDMHRSVDYIRHGSFTFLPRE